jgi:hypothetical protein
MITLLGLISVGALKQYLTAVKGKNQGKTTLRSLNFDYSGPIGHDLLL